MSDEARLAAKLMYHAERAGHCDDCRRVRERVILSLVREYTAAQTSPAEWPDL